MANKTLQAARKEKNDEFYTQLADIENELKHYKQHFEGKTVLCNCDDPYESNFFKYFAMNFNFLKLKKLIATCYDSSPIAFTQLSSNRLVRRGVYVALWRQSASKVERERRFSLGGVFGAVEASRHSGH